MGQGDLEGSLDRLDLLGVTEIRRPAAGPQLDEGGDPLGLAGEVGVGLERGDGAGGAGQEAAQDGLSPIQSRLLEFPGVRVRGASESSLLESLLLQIKHGLQSADGRPDPCYHCVTGRSLWFKRGSFMESQAADDQHAEVLRKTVFLALVEAQDHGMDVVQSRKLMVERFNVTDAQLREIEREGLDRQWPPL
jgi:hypothetical protein